MFKIISSREEITILKRAFDQWGIFHIYENLDMIVKPVEKIMPSNNDMNNPRLQKNKENVDKVKLTKRSDFEVYFCSNKQQKEFAIKFQPISSGIMMGRVLNKKFLPNIIFAEMVVKYNFELNYPYIMLDSNGTNLATYGRDIMGNSIVSYFKDIKENQILIMLNQKKEVIGIGRSRFNDGLITQFDKVTVDNIQDIGTYYLKSENDFYLSK
ncbi:MAG TPA: hypothetical protein VIY08_03800 [Candidatus Nitrosocosmicus sp.]